MAEEIEDSITLDNVTYTIRVIEGNHGGWLFVKRDNVTIYEQPGYADYSKAVEDGKKIAIADAEQQKKGFSK